MQGGVTAVLPLHTRKRATQPSALCGGACLQPWAGIDSQVAGVNGVLCLEAKGQAAHLQQPQRVRHLMGGLGALLQARGCTTAHDSQR